MYKRQGLIRFVDAFLTAGCIAIGVGVALRFWMFAMGGMLLSLIHIFAAQAMTNILENLNGIAAIGIGIGMMTVVGQCLGAGRKDEAIYYIKKLTAVAEIEMCIRDRCHSV